MSERKIPLHDMYPLVMRFPSSAEDLEVSRGAVHQWFGQNISENHLFTKSCTSAFEVIADYLEIQEGDEVIAPAYCFPSILNPIVRRGGKIKWCDSEDHRPHIDVSLLESMITSHTKAIIVIHYAGIACDMPKLQCIRDSYDIPIIEDAAHALGVTYDGKPLGSFFDFGTFSFHSTKNVSCYEGGALTFADYHDAEHLDEIANFGTNRTAVIQGKLESYTWRRLGGAHELALPLYKILFPQLRALTHINEARRLLCIEYDQSLRSLQSDGWSLPFMDQHTNGHIYPICCPVSLRRELISYLNTKGIGAAFHYLTLSRSPLGCSKVDLASADRFSDCLIRLPIYYGMSTDEISCVIDALLLFRDNHRFA